MSCGLGPRRFSIGINLLRTVVSAPGPIYHGFMKLFFIGVLCGGFWSLPAQDQGLLPRWEVIELSKSILESVDQAQSVLAEVRPKEWLQDGAPAAYMDQHEGLQADLANLRLSAEALGRQPENTAFLRKLGIE